jgi:ATP-independent RNA helicase DbpA
MQPINQTDPQSPFNQLPLREELLSNLATLDYTSMTPIQSATLPIMLKNNDVIAQAKTGSGKTAAFGLTILNKLKVEIYHVQALILCPTRELAEQVSQSLRRYARLMHNVKILNLSGGMSMRPQLDSLRHGAHIIVGTPGRVQKHLDHGSLNIGRLHTLVLDEADRMLDMGFYDDIAAIIALCPKPRQTLLFSATYPDEIKKIAKKFMQSPQEIVIESAEDEELDIEQRFYEVSNQAAKLPLLKALLHHYHPESAIIFCNTKQLTTDLTDMLNQAGFSAAALNGDMEQVDRDQAVIRFTNKSVAILVATDVAARGLDIKELPAVINFELAFEDDVHIHRIGRTGRAGSKGIALSLTTPGDGERLCAIEDKLGHAVTFGKSSELTNTSKPVKPDMVTLCLSAGKRDKIRPGDILGALTKDAGLPGDAIGKIDITAVYAYVAVKRSDADTAYRHFQDGKLKGRKVRVMWV